MEITTFVFLVLGTIAAIITALPVLGVDIRLFGKPEMPTTPAIDAPSKTRGWLALFLASLALLGSSWGLISSVIHRHELATGIQIKSPELFTPSDPKYHFGLRIHLETDADSTIPTEVLLICSGDIAEGTEKFLNGGGMSLVTASTKVIENHRDVIILKWGEPWKKDNPVVVELFSDHPLSAKYVIPINYKGNVPYI